MKIKMKARYKATFSQDEMETLSTILNYADAYVLRRKDDAAYERLAEELLEALDQFDDGEAQTLHDTAYAFANRNVLFNSEDW